MLAAATRDATAQYDGRMGIRLPVRFIVCGEGHELYARLCGFLRTRQWEQQQQTTANAPIARSHEDSVSSRLPISCPTLPGIGDDRRMSNFSLLESEKREIPDGFKLTTARQRRHPCPAATPGALACNRYTAPCRWLRASGKARKLKHSRRSLTENNARNPAKHIGRNYNDDLKISRPLRRRRRPTVHWGSQRRCCRKIADRQPCRKASHLIRAWQPTPRSVTDVAAMEVDAAMQG
jgi:hypothetical protein